MALSPGTRLGPYEIAAQIGVGGPASVRLTSGELWRGLVRLGPYEIAARIGVGGMGEVYQATDMNLARQVAIKVLPASVASDPERLARFDREAKTLAAYLADPQAYIVGNRMSFAGVTEKSDRDDLIAYLEQAVRPTEGP